MTIKQYFKNNRKWNVECDMSVPHRCMNVNIVFENNGSLDETQLSIESFNINELSQLYDIFCAENNLPRNTATNIIVAQVAATMDELD